MMAKPLLSGSKGSSFSNLRRKSLKHPLMEAVSLPSAFTPAEQDDWQRRLAEANRCNIFCHCRQCQREWVSSTPEACVCGSQQVETIACWQFPDG
jgi:hypothetical protein